MKLNILKDRFSICKLKSTEHIDLSIKYSFAAVTDEEISLVCPHEKCPSDTLAREDGWRGLRIEGSLDFSLVGVLAKISSVLTEGGISIFVVSTFNTDYIFIKEENLSLAAILLEKADYIVEQ